MSLACLVTNDYESWTLTNWVLGSGVIEKIRSTIGGVHCIAEKSFTLSSIPSDIRLTVEAAAEISGDASVLLQVRVTRPDSALWEREYELSPPEWAYSGNLVDDESLIAFCTQTGEYTIKLNASLNVNEVGAYAIASYSNVSLLTDDPPANLTVVAVAQTTIELDWADDTGADEYTVYWRAGSDTWSSDTATSSSYTITELERGTEYTCRVTSINTYGESTYAETPAETEERPTQQLEESLSLEDVAWRARCRICGESVSLEDGITAAPAPAVEESERVIITGDIDGGISYFTTSTNSVMEVVTPLFDFGSPETIKVLSHVVIKGDPPSPVTVEAYVSTTQGVSWSFFGSGVLQKGSPLFIYGWVAGPSFMLKLTGTNLYLQGLQAVTAEGGRR